MAGLGAAAQPDTRAGTVIMSVPCYLSVSLSLSLATCFRGMHDLTRMVHVLAVDIIIIV